MRAKHAGNIEKLLRLPPLPHREGFWTTQTIGLPRNAQTNRKRPVGKLALKGLFLQKSAITICTDQYRALDAWDGFGVRLLLHSMKQKLEFYLICHLRDPHKH